MSDQKYSCQGCTRTDLTLTANGKVRSHAANGKRASADNPACGMGSEYPKEATQFHTHQFEYADDENGHSGSFCDCGMEEPDDPTELNRALHEEKDRVIAAVGEAGPAKEHLTPPNPWRDPLPGGLHDNAGQLPHDRQSVGTCTRCGEPRDGHAHDVTTPETAPQSAADSFLDGADDDNDDSEEQDDGRRYFPSRYDGKCVTCLEHFDEGDMITRGPDDDGWEAQDCCGEDAVQRPERPKAVARTLPVVSGRYKFPHPVTGKQTSGQRASKYAEGVQDKYLLDQWKGRMIVLGLAVRPDLVDKAVSTLRNDDPVEVARTKRDYFNKIAEDAKLAAGSKSRAEKGTKLHKYTEELDGGTKTLDQIPEDYRTDAGVYAAALEEAGFRPVKGLIERSVFCDELGVTGTFDRVLECVRDTQVIDLDGRPVQIHAGEFVIGDVKSGSNIEAPWLEILVQEAIYAHAVNENGIAVQDTAGGPWRWVPLEDFGLSDYGKPAKVREDVGIVMHVPYGSGECKIYYADLITGWQGAQLCRANRDFWKIKMPQQPVMSYVAVTEDITTPELDDDCGQCDHVPGSPCDLSCPCTIHNPKPAKNIMEAVKRARDAAKESVRLGFTPPTAATVKMPTREEAPVGTSKDQWAGRFTAARTREEANTAWREAKDAGLPEESIKQLVKLVRLNQEQEPSSRPPEPAPVPDVRPEPERRETKPQQQDGPSLTQRANAVTTKAEASAVFKEARKKIDDMEGEEQKVKAKAYLDKLVKIMTDRLAPV